MFKIKSLFILFILILINPVFAITEEELKQYTYIDFYSFVSSYNVRKRNIVNGFDGKKKIELMNNTFTSFIDPPEKYVAYLEYRGADRKIDTYQRPFLKNWFTISHGGKGYKIDDTAESILIDDNFGLFYTSTMYSTRGKTYFLTTQKAVNDSMKKNLKNGELIQVYLWNLGQFTSDIPVFVVVGYERAPKMSDAIKEEIYFQQYLPVLKYDILERRYDKAKGNIERLLKQYPKNMDLRLNLCLIYNKTNFFDKSISCYNDIIKTNPRNYDAYYGVSMAYYNNTAMNAKTKMQLIIENTTKALDIIQSLSPEPAGSLAMIAYNSHYLRAMAKIALGDRTAMDDLAIITRNEPALVSSSSLDLFESDFNKNNRGK